MRQATRRPPRRRSRIGRRARRQRPDAEAAAGRGGARGPVAEHADAPARAPTTCLRAVSRADRATTSPGRAVAPGGRWRPRPTTPPTADTDADTDEPAAPRSPRRPDAEFLRRRARGAAAARVDAHALLKRALADEQNEALDRLRRATSVPTVAELVGSPAEQAARYAGAAEAALRAALIAGASSAGYDETAATAELDATGAVAEVLEVMQAELVSPLRERIERAVARRLGRQRRAGRRCCGRPTASGRCSAWTPVADHLTLVAHGRGTLLGVPAGTPVRWLVDPSAPRAPTPTTTPWPAPFPAARPFPPATRTRRLIRAAAAARPLRAHSRPVNPSGRSSTPERGQCEGVTPQSRVPACSVRPCAGPATCPPADDRAASARIVEPGPHRPDRHIRRRRRPVPLGPRHRWLLHRLSLVRRPRVPGGLVERARRQDRARRRCSPRRSSSC